MQHTLTYYDRWVERRNPALGKEHHAVCTCGWQGPWVSTTEEVPTQCPRRG
jgi:hypothetical protein